MLEYVFIGLGYAFAAAVQPGPFQAFLFSRVAERGWRATLPAVLAPVVSDGPIAVLALVVLKELPRLWLRVLQGAGGVLLLYLAWTTLRGWRTRADAAPKADGGVKPKTLAEAIMVNLLNPNPYLGWSLILGPLVLEAWAQGPARAIALIASFYAAIVVLQGALVILFGTARFLTPRTQRGLLLVSALLLAALGAYQLGSAIVA